MNPLGSHHLDILGKKIAEAARNLQELIKSLKQEGYTFLDYDNVLLKNGWFFPFDISVTDAMLLAFQFENDESNEANNYLIKYYRKNANNILNELVAMFPERENVLKEAFSAHRKKMYYASTILFLSQADGITDNIIFMGKKFKEFYKYNSSHPLAELFNNKNPLTSSFNKGKKTNLEEESLNRHGIIHGNMMKFGNKLNSCKALSLLYFVSNFRNKVDE